MGTQRISIIRPEGDGYSVATKIVPASAVESEIASARRLLGENTGDIVVVPEHLSTTPPSLVLMDVDSTFINEEVIELLAEHAGKREEVAAVTERAMRGELDFAASLHARVATLEGLSTEIFASVLDAVTFTPGVPAFVRAVQEAGGTVALVSGGFEEIVVPLAARLGIEDVLANRLGIEDGKLTGQVIGAVVDRRAKAERLARICEHRGFDPRATVAIGDGANDIDMIEAAGFGIAFCAKPALAEVADAAVSVRRMDAVWSALTGSPSLV